MATPESVAALALEVDSMKAILSTKIGANDEIMVTVTDKLGSLTAKLDEFYTQLMQNDSTIKQAILDNSAEVSDLKVRIGTKVGESDGVLVGLQAALGAQQAEIISMKLQIGAMDTQQQTTYSKSEGKSALGIIDCKGITSLKTLDNGNNFNQWTNRFRNALEQYRPFAREALTFLESQNLEVIAATLRRMREHSGGSLGVGSHHDATPYGNTDAIAELYDLKYPLGDLSIWGVESIE